MPLAVAIKVRRKPVYVGQTSIGCAATWHEVASLLSKLLQRLITAREAQNQGSEGPDGFYIEFRSPHPHEKGC